ncbi:MAG: hypothetical protein ABWZ91_16350 [Nocardioides sp.]
MRTPPIPGAKLALRIVTVALFVTFPFACALVAVAYAPPSHIEIAGQTVSVKPVLGQDTSRLLGGALVLPDHAHIDVLGKDIGVDVDADWNQLIPSDKRTRAYLTALWDDPTPQIGRLRDAARRNVVLWSSGGFLSGLGVVVGTWTALAYRRRRLRGYPSEQADLVRRHNRRLRGALALVATVAVLAVDFVAVRIYQHEDHHTVVSSPVFAGTSLEGTEVNGLAAEVLPFLSILRPRSTFYDTVADNLERALADRPSLQRSGDEVVLVLAEDFEDVNGMARQVGLAADLVDASFLALTGDLTFAGLAVETYIIDTVDYYSDHRPVYFAPGLHDTEVVVEAAAARGWHVADGQTIDADGLSLLAVADPRVSTVGGFGTGWVLRDPDVDVDQFVSDTVEEACAEQPDLVILHDHRLGRQIAGAGCQEVAVLDGRSYQFVGPQEVPVWTATSAAGSSTVEFTGGSTGGHVTTVPDPGSIQSPARFAILSVQPDSLDATYAVVTVQPDATVTVTPEISLDVPYAEFVDTGSTGLAPTAIWLSPGGRDGVVPHRSRGLPAQSTSR